MLACHLEILNQSPYNIKKIIKKFTSIFVVDVLVMHSVRIIYNNEKIFNFLIDLKIINQIFLIIF